MPYLCSMHQRKPPISPTVTHLKQSLISLNTLHQDEWIDTARILKGAQRHIRRSVNVILVLRLLSVAPFLKTPEKITEANSAVELPNDVSFY